jgi:hypothetical protein
LEAPVSADLPDDDEVDNPLPDAEAEVTSYATQHAEGELSLRELTDLVIDTAGRYRSLADYCSGTRYEYERHREQLLLALEVLNKPWDARSLLDAKRMCLLYAIQEADGATVAEAVVHVRERLATSYPDLASALRQADLEATLHAWDTRTERSGRPRSGEVGKWRALERLSANAGLPEWHPDSWEALAQRLRRLQL